MEELSKITLDNEVYLLGEFAFKIPSDKRELFIKFGTEVVELAQQLNQSNQDLKVAVEALESIEEHRICEIGYKDEEDSVLDTITQALAKLREAE